MEDPVLMPHGSCTDNYSYTSDNAWYLVYAKYQESLNELRRIWKEAFMV
jgi:hypothetical protein